MSEEFPILGPLLAKLEKQRLQEEVERLRLAAMQKPAEKLLTPKANKLKKNGNDSSAIMWICSLILTAIGIIVPLLLDLIHKK